MDDATLARTLDEARAAAPSAAAGLYGPGSYTWLIDRELALIAGGGRALLLQIAHPSVAAAVDAHSDFRADPMGRSRRTFDAMFTLCFGDLDAALATARRINARHVPVVGVAPPGRSPAAGAPYDARRPDLLLWVQATLVDTAVCLFEAMVRPLAPVEKEGYWRESRLLARLLGVPDAHLPPDYPSFVRYFAEVVDGPLLEAGPVARTQCRDLLSQPLWPALASFVGRGRPEEPTRRWWRLERGLLGWPGRRLGHLLTAGLLPPRLRAAFGFSWSRVDDVELRVAFAALRRLYNTLPGSARYHPAYHSALARLRH